MVAAILVQVQPSASMEVGWGLVAGLDGRTYG